MMGESEGQPTFYYPSSTYMKAPRCQSPFLGPSLKGYPHGPRRVVKNPPRNLGITHAGRSLRPRRGKYRGVGNRAVRCRMTRGAFEGGYKNTNSLEIVPCSPAIEAFFSPFPSFSDQSR